MSPHGAAAAGRSPHTGTMAHFHSGVNLHGC